MALVLSSRQISNVLIRKKITVIGKKRVWLNKVREYTNYIFENQHSFYCNINKTYTKVKLKFFL